MRLFDPVFVSVGDDPGGSFRSAGSLRSALMT